MADPPHREPITSAAARLPLSGGKGEAFPNPRAGNQRKCGRKSKKTRKEIKGNRNEIQGIIPPADRDFSKA
jgi:hypothetical protein